MIGALARRELRDLYAGAGGWLLLAAVQGLLAWLLFQQLEIYARIQPRLTALQSPLGVGDLVIRPTLNATALALLLALPLLGMRTLAGERRSGRLALLLSSPAGALRLTLGKWLGLLLGALPLVSLVAGMIGALALGTRLDPGRLFTGVLGLLLVEALAAAAVLWFSSLTEQPLAAAAMSWGLLLLGWLVDPQPLAPLSLQAHVAPFFDGELSSAALVWFLAPTAAFLALTVHRLWRLGGGE